MRQFKNRDGKAIENSFIPIQTVLIIYRHQLKEFLKAVGDTLVLFLNNLLND
ncbi:hypothetical protein GCM10007424_11020 [Flavobacterium suaedae]|uniref:Transposase n=1 Tax=Flavobacterium suaedae TaxID=1767027 RepID=A0ABQ1JNG5_9FLAO|nr:hypothetical protein GCM10007424_11020 [Flavobacterium suaedae]